MRRLRLPLLLVALCLLCRPAVVLAMSQADVRSYRETVREMFLFAWQAYLDHAFPMDELNPIRCGGRGRDYANPGNIGLNDVLGDFSLTLLDAMDTLCVMGEREEFARAVALAQRYVDVGRRANTVQVFETNIRVLGGLLSAHMYASDARWNCTVPGYDGHLLALALDVGERLLPAFNRSTTGLPYARVNLIYGVPKREINQTCTAGAGSLILEFGVLSRLTGDSRFEDAAKSTLRQLWSRRSLLNLIGNTIDIQTGVWADPSSGIGAGIDSFFEYLFKAYILFGDDEYLGMFNEAYTAILQYVRDQNGILYSQVNMFTAQHMATWIDSLSAFFPGLQVLYGDLDNAKRLHELYFTLWRRFGALPERWDYYQRKPIIPFYPLRPELMESTYFLYQATKDSYYLHAGAKMISDLQTHARKPCGFATIHNLNTMANDDRMESFFLSETLKYLYLLFDEDNIVNHMDGNFIFTTEGHVLALNASLTNTTGTNNRQQCPAPVQRFHPFRIPPLPNLEVDLIHNVVGWTPENLEIFPGECPAMPLETMEKQDQPMEMQIMLQQPFGSSSAPESSATIMRLRNGDFLLDTLHNIRVAFVSGSAGTAKITKINDTDIPSGISLLVLQDPLIPINNHLPFVDDLPMGVMRLYDESMLGVGHRAVFISYDIISAAFGPRLEDEKGLDGFLEFVPAHARLCAPLPPNLRPFVKDKVLIILRGNCTFSEKTLYAQQAGVRAALIVNTDGTLYPMGEMEPNQLRQFVLNLNLDQDTADKRTTTNSTTPGSIYKIPAVMIRLQDGLGLIRRLLSEGRVLHVAMRSQPAIASLLFSPSASSSTSSVDRLAERHLLSIQHRRIVNLALITGTEYRWINSLMGIHDRNQQQQLQSPTEPSPTAHYQYRRRFKRRLLHPGMHWSCLRASLIHVHFCCAFLPST